MRARAWYRAAHRGSLPALVAAALFGMALPVGVAAQRAPALGGAELRVGLTFPEQAIVAPSLAVEADLGYVWRPALRLIAGVSRFRANIDREPGDDEGSFGATGLWLGGRYDLLLRSATGVYVRGAVTAHRVDADAWDREVGALLAGTYAGAALAVGARRTLDDRGRFSATLELRRTLMNNIGNTALEAGIRFQRRGHFAYAADGLALAPPPGPGVVPPPAPVQLPAARADETPAAPPAAPTDTAAARRDAAARAAAVQAQRAAAAAEDSARAAAVAEQQARDVATAEQRAAAQAAGEVAAEAVLRQGLDRAAAAMPSISSVRETGDAFAVTVGGTAFASGAATLRPAARAELRALATVLAGYPGHLISVEGHTDAVGNAAANQTLSQERAAAVRAALIVEGVDPLWTGAVGMGAGSPVAPNETAAGRAANRRVEVRVLRRPCAEPPRPDAAGRLACPR